jgi:hypothetical protein
MPAPITVLPSYDGGGISSIPATILQAFGGGLEGHPPLHSNILPTDFFDKIKTVVFILVDGLGYNLYQRLVRPEMALARLAKQGLEKQLTSVLPSTTTTALATLSTGLTPQEHGLVGYKLFLREVDEIANMIRFSPVQRQAPYPRKRLNPQAFFDHRTLYEQLHDIGVTSRIIIKYAYARSPLSKMFYRGAEVVSHAGTHDAFATLRRMLEQRDGSPTFIYLYWDPIDTVSHHNGPLSDEVAAEIEGLDFALRTQILDRFKGDDVALMLTADHGHINTLPANRLKFNTSPNILDMLERPPSGDSRLPYLHVKQGLSEDVARAVEASYDGVARVNTVQDALARGWFGIGECHPETRNRLGDLIVSVANGYKIGYRYSAEETESIGCHGGCDADEMLVPFIASRLD